MVDMPYDQTKPNRTKPNLIVLERNSWFDVTKYFVLRIIKLLKLYNWVKNINIW